MLLKVFRSFLLDGLMSSKMETRVNFFLLMQFATLHASIKSTSTFNSDIKLCEEYFLLETFQPPRSTHYMYL